MATVYESSTIERVGRLVRWVAGLLLLATLGFGIFRAFTAMQQNERRLAEFGVRLPSAAGNTRHGKTPGGEKWVEFDLTRRKDPPRWLDELADKNRWPTREDCSTKIQACIKTKIEGAEHTVTYTGLTQRYRYTISPKN